MEEFNTFYPVLGAKQGRNNRKEQKSLLNGSGFSHLQENSGCLFL